MHSPSLPIRGSLRLGLSPHGKRSPSDGGLSWNGSCLHQLNKAFSKPCPLHQTGGPPRHGQCLPALRSGLGAPQTGLGFPPHATGPISEWGFFCTEWRLPELFAAAFAPPPARGSLQGPLGLVVWLLLPPCPPKPMQAWASPGPPPQPPASTTTDLQRSPRGGEGPVVPPRGSHLLLAAPPREDLGR